ncbi:MAG: dTDP-4-dehydrorhamnose 3,5-epimerase [Kiloniellales bacterium]
MEITRLAIPEVVRIKPRRFADDRGYFAESWNGKKLREAGFDFDFVQDNEPYSLTANTVRGLHYQAPPNAQAKLVRVVRGAVLDVAVDIRRGSPSYGKWVSERLTAAEGEQLLVPRGFLHGFITLLPDTLVSYKVDNYYAPESDGAIRFDDPLLAIDWGVDPKDAVLSQKDEKAPGFAGFESPFVYTPSA